MSTMSEIKVLVSDDLSKAAVEILSQAGFTVDVRTGLPAAQLSEIIGGYHGLAVRSATKVTADLLSHASNLKIVGRAGVGVDNIDVKAATERKVQVINTPSGNAIAAAELAVAYLFALARKIPQATASMKKGEWEKKKFMGVEITGKTLVVLKMRVLAHDPVWPVGAAAPTGVDLASFDDVLSRADFVTLHLPFLPSTQNLFSTATFAKMKKGAYFINCARGGIVDETALYEALKSGHLGGAAIDVFEKEPCGPLPLFELDNVLASPHVGASTKEAQDKVAIELAEVFVDYFKGGQVRNAVNKL
jgi:D-3-phosphoglycerate dehydrogenase / 2-oxoglutarate reductase